MKKSSIDIGSNSILLFIGEIIDKKLIIIEDHAAITALGRGIKDSGKFHPESRAESLLVLKRYAGILKKYFNDFSEVKVTATEAARRASDFDEFKKEVYKETGLNINLIDAKEEARLTSFGIYQGLSSNQRNKPFWNLDIGGASSEISLFCPSSLELLSSISLPIGSVLATELIETGDFDLKLKELWLRSSEALQKLKIDGLFIGAAGTITAIGALILKLEQFNAEKIHGLELNLLQLKDLEQELAGLREQEIQKVYPLLGKRAKTIQGGLKLLIYILEKCHIPKLMVSNFGLRHGAAVYEPNS